MEKEKLGEQLEALRAQQSELDDQRRKDVAACRRNNRELELDIVKIQQTLAHLANGPGAQLTADLRAIEGRASDAAVAKEVFFRQLPTEFPREELAGEFSDEGLDQAFAPEAAEMDDAHKKNLRALQTCHAEDCGAVQVQHLQRLRERRQTCAEIARATDDFKVRAQYWQRQLQADLIAAHALVQQLSRLLDGIEGGVPSRDGKS